MPGRLGHSRYPLPILGSVVRTLVRPFISRVLPPVLVCHTVGGSRAPRRRVVGSFREVVYTHSLFFGTHSSDVSPVRVLYPPTPFLVFPVRPLFVRNPLHHVPVSSPSLTPTVLDRSPPLLTRLWTSSDCLCLFPETLQFFHTLQVGCHKIFFKNDVVLNDQKERDDVHLCGFTYNPSVNRISWWKLFLRRYKELSEPKSFRGFMVQVSDYNTSRPRGVWDTKV